MLSRVAALDTFKDTATGQLQTLATGVNAAQEEAEVARAGKPRLVYYWTNQDPILIKAGKWWETKTHENLPLMYITPGEVVEMTASFRADASPPEC